MSPVRAIIAQEWERGGQLRDDVFPGAFVVMPDHFHGLIRIRKGRSELGHVIGAFKAAVSRAIRRLHDTSVPGTIRLWHRNYYEMIVRTPEAERNIREYIRMNPWKLVLHAVHRGQSFRMIGNPALLNRETIAMLCSRKCPPAVLAAAKKHAQSAGSSHCFISGFHSPPEKAILDMLLGSDAGIICCPAWGIDTMRIPTAWLPALEANRMLILEMRDRAGDLAAAEARNRCVLDLAEKRWIPHISPDGLLDRLLRPRKGDTHVAP